MTKASDLIDALNLYSEAKRQLLEAANAYLSSQTKELQDVLAKIIVNAASSNLNFEDGKLSFDTKNISALLKIIEQLKLEYNTKMTTVANRSVTSLIDITDAADNYFKTDKIPNYTRRARNDLFEKIGVSGGKPVKNGYLQNILLDTSPIDKIRVEALKHIARNASQKEFVSSMTTKITGSPLGISAQGDVLGIIEQHHRQTEISDFFDRYERTYSNTVAKEIGLDKARYSGGLMTTTRNFCRERQGKIFTRKEIKGWEKLSFKGKNSGYNPFTDLGGYNCRHTLDWVSDEAAKEIEDRRQPTPDTIVHTIQDPYSDDIDTIGYRDQVFIKNNWEFLKSENENFPLDVLIDIHNTKGSKFDTAVLDRYPILKKGISEWTSSSNNLRHPIVDRDPDLIRARKVFQTLAESLRIEEKTVWRGNNIKFNGVKLPPNETYDHLKKWKKGKILKFGENSEWGSSNYDMTILSSSTVEDRAFYFYENIMVHIVNDKGVRGFNISSVSGYTEDEVIFGDSFEYEFQKALFINGRPYMFLKQKA